MNKIIQGSMTAMLLTTIGTTGAIAQTPQTEKIPLKVQIVVSVFEGDRKVSSAPYTLYAAANGGRVSVNLGTQVPIQSGSGGTAYSYTNIGTQISCTVTSDSGAFKVDLSFDDKSVMAPTPPSTSAATTPRPPDAVTFQNWSYSSSFTLKDGETKQLISAPDKGTGQTMKIDVTLNLETPKRAALDLDADYLENGFRVLAAQSN